MSDSEAVRQRVSSLIENFEEELKSGDLRSKVIALIPIFQNLRELWQSLISVEDASSAESRLLYYFRKYPGMVIDEDELLVVSGIQDYPRRIWEIRTQFGWAIASGVTIKEMSEDEEDSVPDHLVSIKPSQYVLMRTEEDRDAAHRWHLANCIRRERGASRDKILKYLRENVGRSVTNEELRYVAGNRTEWARCVRELRSEQGWPIATRANGRPDLEVGVYVLQADRQSPAHDRKIPDALRRQVLRRDEYTCRECGWSHDEWNPSDPRHLELHHVRHLARGGGNTEENLKTLCTVCHDGVHREER